RLAARSPALSGANPGAARRSQGRSHRRRAQRRPGERHHLRQRRVAHESHRPAVDQDCRADELPAIAMATAVPSRRAARDPAETARLQFILRFSVATTASFVICEWMGWQPSALAPVLTAVLLASLPSSPPPKVGVGLVVLMAICAWLAFFLTTWLSQTPQLLFGVIGFIMFLAFAGLARAKGQ